MEVIPIDDVRKLFNERVHAFQESLRLTALSAIPAAILIAAVLGRFTPRELTAVILAAGVAGVISMLVSHAYDRHTLAYVRDRLDDPDRLTFAGGLTRLHRFRTQVFVSYFIAYAVGVGFVLVVGNSIGGVPILTNAIALFVAALTAACVDGFLNVINAEGLVAELIAILSLVRGEDPPLPARTRGGIARRFLIVMVVLAAVTIVALGGGSLHLLRELQAGTIQVSEVYRLGLIYTLCAIGVALLISIMAARILSRSIAQPILHTVDLMERLRVGDLLRIEELRGEPRHPHEAGSLVAAFANANEGLARLALAGESISDGDLTVKIVPSSERDVMAHAFARVADVMRRVVVDVQVTASLLESSSQAITSRSEQFSADANANARDLSRSANAMATLDQAVARVAEGATELADTSTQLRATAERLGAAAQTNAAGLDELAQTARSTIEAAGEVLEIAAAAGESADSATAAIIQADRTSQDAERVMGDLVSTIGSLRISSREIGAITAKIDEIADQTNLLALNAAIEAARAGEHGRGFAVVADEIRKLADSSATATKEIAALIRSVQTETDRAVDVTRLGSAAVESGRAKTSQVADALARIVDNVNAVRERIGSVVHAQREQKQATDSLVESTLLVERLTGDNVHMAQALSTLAGNLQTSSNSGAQAVRDTSEDVSAVAQRGERIASATQELQSLTGALHGEAERIRAAVAEFRTGGPTLGASPQPRLPGRTANGS